MIDWFKKTGAAFWFWLLGIGALFGAVVVYAWVRVKTAKAQALITVRRARIASGLESAQKRAQERRDAAAAVVVANHAQRLQELDARAAEIKAAAAESRGALVSALNRSFGK